MYTSNGNAFETANYSYVAAVPEPGETTIMLSGLGLLGLIVARKRRSGPINDREVLLVATDLEKKRRQCPRFFVKVRIERAVHKQIWLVPSLQSLCT